MGRMLTSHGQFLKKGIKFDAVLQDNAKYGNALILFLSNHLMRRFAKRKASSRWSA